MRRRTAHPANYAREPPHAPRAKSTWPGALSAPCALETRGPLLSRGAESPAGESPHGAAPWGPACEGNTRLPAPIFGAQPPAVGHQGPGAPRLRPSRPPGARSPGALDLAGIHLRDSRRGRRRGPRWLQRVYRGGRAPLQSALGKGSHRPREMLSNGSFKKQGDLRAESPLQDEGARTEASEKKESEEATKAPEGGEHSAGKRAAASGPRPGRRICAGFPAAAAPRQPGSRGGRPVVASPRGRFTFYFLPLSRVGSPPGPNPRQQ